MALKDLEEREFEEWIMIQEKLKSGEIMGYFREVNF